MDLARDANPHSHVLQCMEIWGGVEPAAERIDGPGLDGWVYSRPYGDAAQGGDIYYFSLCRHGAIARLVVADVAGHGETVGALAATLHGLLKRHIDTPDQAALVRSVSDEFAHLAGGGEFATALVATYFALDDSLLVCNAGHPRPLWFRTADRSWRLLCSDLPEARMRLRDLPLGVVGGTGYSQFGVILGRDDMLLVYTDSLVEARNGDGQILGEPGLLKLAKDLPPLPPEPLGRRLLAAVGDYADGQPFEDDVTLVVLHHNAVDPPLSAR